MSKRPTVDPDAQAKAPVSAGGAPTARVDTNFRPQATTVPDLAVIAGIYLDAIRSGRRPIEALMEKFNVDRDSAKGWPALCRDARLLPARDQPQVAAAPDDTSHRFRFAG